MKNIETTLQNWGEKITEALKAAIPAQKDNNGMLKQNLSFSINYAGFPIVFELKLADYYRYIDEGRKPGRFPPPEVLKAWIINKQLQLKPITTLKNANKNVSKPARKSVISDQKRINKLSYLIGRKIAKNGIPATRFYSSTITPELLSELQNNLSVAFKQDVIVMLGL